MKFKAIEVLKSVGIAVSKLPKLAKSHVLKEHVDVGSKSGNRALLSFFSKQALESVDEERSGIAATGVAASIGALTGCTKDGKEALYLTLCALGLSDHGEALVKTIKGNATKWNRPKDKKGRTPLERYSSDFAPLSFFSEHKALEKHAIATFDAIQAQLVELARDSAEKLRKAK